MVNEQRTTLLEIPMPPPMYPNIILSAVRVLGGDLTNRGGSTALSSQLIPQSEYRIRRKAQSNTLQIPVFCIFSVIYPK